MNPGKRVVCVGSEAERDMWLGKQGFREATEDEIIAHQTEKQVEKELRDQEKEADPDGVFVRTVQPGGNGYGTSHMAILKRFNELGLKYSRYYTGQKVAFIYHAPQSVAGVQSPFKILYTMFESTKIPEEWGEYLERVDEIIVPSRFCQEAFLKAGYKSTVIPLGYDSDTYTYKPRKPKAQGEVFTFLHYNAFNIRKGFTEVLKAFIQEFDKSEPVRMVFKTTLDNPPIPISPQIYPHIQVLTGEYTQKQMNELLHTADCFVYPSRGEGFGMTPLEAMATGIPAIVPNAHGISEYFDSEYMYEVKVKDTCPGLYSRYKGQDVGTMVVCSVRDLRKQMRYVYEHRDEAIEMGKKGSQYAKNYTIKRSANQLQKIIKKYQSLEAPEVTDPDILPLKKIA